MNDKKYFHGALKYMDKRNTLLNHAVSIANFLYALQDPKGMKITGTGTADKIMLEIIAKEYDNKLLKDQIFRLSKVTIDDSVELEFDGRDSYRQTKLIIKANNDSFNYQISGSQISQEFYEQNKDKIWSFIDGDNYAADAKSDKVRLTLNKQDCVLGLNYVDEMLIDIEKMKYYNAILNQIDEKPEKPIDTRSLKQTWDEKQKKLEKSLSGRTYQQHSSN